MTSYTTDSSEGYHSDLVHSNSFNDPKALTKYLEPRAFPARQVPTYQSPMNKIGLMMRSTILPASSPMNSKNIMQLSVTNPSSPALSFTESNADTRDLVKLNEKLTETVLNCIDLDTHNRLQQLQIDWLKRHADFNTSTIEKLYRASIESAEEKVLNSKRSISTYESKIVETQKMGENNDQIYQQLLAKRTSAGRDLFNYQRKKAENTAEIEFLRGRVQHFNEEIQFYTLKNSVLDGRKGKLRYELDQDLYAVQVLQMELEVLKNDKISKEDSHRCTFDEVRDSVNIKQITAIEPSNSFRDHLAQELRRIRTEYEKKLEMHSEELHRRYELEAHRFQMQRFLPVPNAEQEHEQQMNIYRREKKDADQQITSYRSKNQEIESEIRALDKEVFNEKHYENVSSNAREQIAMLKKTIAEREQQLLEATNRRNQLKHKIERYRDQVDRYQPKHKYLTIDDQIVSSTPTPIDIVSIPSKVSLDSPSLLNRTFESVTERSDSFVEYNLTELKPTVDADFDVDAECKEIHEALQNLTVTDVSKMIRILGSRTSEQRLKIRQRYKMLFNNNLSDAIEVELDTNVKKLLKILLLSSIEHDCYEIQRVLTNINVDENILLEIFLDRTKKQIEAIRETYLKLFQNSLENEINDNRDSFQRRLVYSLICSDNSRDDTVHVESEKNDAKTLSQNKNLWAINGTLFVNLVTRRGNASLKRVFDFYQHFSMMDIEQTIQKNTDVELGRSLMLIVRFARNKARFFAYELKKCLKGTNTNENNLNRILISRSEIDMAEIKSEYEKISKRTLVDHIQTDTNGNYRRLLVELLRQVGHSLFREIPSFKPTVPVSNVSKSWMNADNDRPFLFDRSNRAKINTLSKIETRNSLHFQDASLIE